MISLTPQIKAITASIRDVNMLMGFAVEAEQIVRWAQDVARLEPNLDMEKLALLMDCFKTEEIVWDKTVGIQNIFRGLKRIKRSEQTNELEILKEIW